MVPGIGLSTLKKEKLSFYAFAFMLLCFCFYKASMLLWGEDVACLSVIKAINNENMRPGGKSFKTQI